MPPPTISLGLNLSNKKQPGPRPPAPGQKRKKPVFGDDDDDSGKEDGGDGAIEISTIGGLDEPSQPASKPKPSLQPPAKRKIPFGGAASKPAVKPLTKKSIFADEDEDDNTDEQLQNNGAPMGLNTKESQGQAQKKSKPGDDEREYTNLSAMHSSRKHAQEAQELDPSIYSYDAVYESLHAKPEKAKAAEGDPEVPKYMTALLRSAEIRKRDQLRARDRMLAKEREAEGDEFADKDKFVTSAYKAQQEELRRVEAEEEEREKLEAERRRQNGDAGMVGFYRDMLSKGEQQHEAVVKATEEAARRVQAGEAPVEEETNNKEKTEAQVAEELNARGGRVAINDEGNVVDKRQLLSAGLNVAPKPKQAPAAAPNTASRPAAKPRFDSGHGGRGGQRARQTEMIAAQLEEQARQEEEAEAAKQKEIADRSRSTKSAGDVSSAKERYLARKKVREEAAKAKGS